MKTWADELKEEKANIEQQRRSRLELAQAGKRNLFEARHVPMAERLRRLIRDMPVEERNLPRHIDFFCEALAPRYHGRRAQRGQVASGLRELGWTRERRWRGDDEGFKALWWPPGESIDA